MRGEGAVPRIIIRGGVKRRPRATEDASVGIKMAAETQIRSSGHSFRPAVSVDGKLAVMNGPGRFRECLRGLT